MDEGLFWALLAATAVVSGGTGYVLGAAARCRVAPAEDKPVPAAPVLAALSSEGALIEILDGPAPAAAACEASRPRIAACKAVSHGAAGLVCELSHFEELAEAEPGRRVVCLFAPRSGAGGVNALEAVIAGVDAGAQPPLMTLAPAAQALNLPGLQAATPDLADPGLVRVRLWLAVPGETPLHFPDAAPDLWINAYDGGQAEENAVTYVSGAGLVMRLRAGLLPQGLKPGAGVVLKCSLFEFREKTFKPHWYAGVVRGLLGPAAGTILVAIGFTHAGAPDRESRQGLAWTPRGGGAK